ncbi:hypothetical protein ACN6LL_008352, partial [Streptomyces violaceoruber]
MRRPARGGRLDRDVQQASVRQVVPGSVEDLLDALDKSSTHALGLRRQAGVDGHAVIDGEVGDRQPLVGEAPYLEAGTHHVLGGGTVRADGPGYRVDPAVT